MTRVGIGLFLIVALLVSAVVGLAISNIYGPDP